MVRGAALVGWRHVWPPRAPQGTSEGVGLPFALGRRGPASQIAPSSHGIGAGSHQSDQFSCGLTMQAASSAASRSSWRSSGSSQ